jgi:hypothetical protein
MSKRPPKRPWIVYVGLLSVPVVARTFGAACRRAFKGLIRGEIISRQPQTDYESGGWKGVSGKLQKR